MNYSLHLTWTGNRGAGTADYETYGREYRMIVDGKPEFTGSADRAFRGDPGLHNPEDLLVMALSSCHLLSYLALCARRGVNVVAYTDHTTGTMKLDGKGGGHFVEVVLRPEVTITSAADVDRAMALHDTAHEQCYIAASCNFPVRHEPVIRVATADDPVPAPAAQA